MTNISFPRLVVSASAIALAAATVSCGPDARPPDAVIAQKDINVVKNTPVVDIHTHTFNASFLPIRGIALAKRNIVPFLPLVSERRVIAITDSISRMAQSSRTRNPLGDTVVTPESPEIVRSVEKARILTGTGESSGSLLTSVSTVTPESVAKDPAIVGIQRARRILENTGERLTDAEVVEVKKISDILSDNKGTWSFKLPLRRFLPISEYVRREAEHFGGCLISPESRVVDIYYKDHADTNISLMVSHMMDMAPSYGQDEDGKVLVPIGEQNCIMEKQQSAAHGNMLYFAAYNPFRDHWGPNAHPGLALQIVKDAYYKHGAFGVKVYPPSGYAPAGTIVPKRSCSWFSNQPGLQWDGRYVNPATGQQIKGDTIDQQLDDLYTWCENEGVPIFTHCGQGEVQAWKRYYKFADPTGWGKVLQRHPNLHLCLGHAGGHDYWFSSRGGQKSWGNKVYELCVKYPNVYCEFGAYDGIVDAEKRSNFTRNIDRCIRASSLDRDYASSIFATKLLYGSDWYMPMFNGSTRGNYLRSFQAAILQLPYENEVRHKIYRQVFHVNAVNFLNIKKRLSINGVPTVLRDNLGKLKQQR